jgi:hypothetical protein
MRSREPQINCIALYAIILSTSLVILTITNPALYYRQVYSQNMTGSIDALTNEGVVPIFESNTTSAALSNDSSFIPRNFTSGNLTQ